MDLITRLSRLSMIRVRIYGRGCGRERARIPEGGLIGVLGVGVRESAFQIEIRQRA